MLYVPLERVLAVYAFLIFKDQHISQLNIQLRNNQLISHNLFSLLIKTTPRSYFHLIYSDK